MTKLTFILILVFQFSRGQTTTFRQLDIATNFKAQEIITDKIKFLKNNKLDFNESKPTLDSIVWYLIRHPRTIISLTIIKAKTSTLNATTGKIGREQAAQIVDYLSKKDINSKRIVSTVSYSEQNPIDDLSVSTRIRVLSNDFVDTETK